MAVLAVAVTLLSELGYKVAAVTGRAEVNGDLLKSLAQQQLLSVAYLRTLAH